MNTKHTPGPWETHFGWDVTGYPCYFIHGVSGGDKEHEPTLQANANVIAAAPDYDAAAKAIFRAVESNAAPMNVEYVLRQMMVEGKRIELDTDLLLDLFAAMSKAEGRQ